MRKTNRQIKRAIANVTGGEWGPNVYGGKHSLWVIIPEDYSFMGLVNRVSAVEVKHHKVISIKASEVK